MAPAHRSAAFCFLVIFASTPCSAYRLGSLPEVSNPLTHPNIDSDPYLKMDTEWMQTADSLTREGNLRHKNRHGDGADKLLVSTTTGLVKGFKKRVFAKKVYIYYGIPFAKPPLGPLRFKKPVAIDPWHGTFDATKLGNSCVQEKYEYFPGFKGEEMWNPNTNISEDCLTLNIWVPAKFRGRGSKNHNAPVLLWIYGGGYMSGTSTLEVYDADILASENDVIVVSVNYRVGAFGFLYLGIDEAPGNMGLWDQALAMKWIRDNIRHFGGDPNSITVFGESAGGGSVSVHLVSPVSQHLLRRGIMQSGTLNAPWSYMSAERALGIGKKLIEDCGCNVTNLETKTDEVIQCMQDIDASVVSAQQWNSYGGILDFPSAPIIDGDFLPKDPVEMLRDGEFKKKEILIGSNMDEGTYFILYDFLDYFSKDDTERSLSRAELDEILDKIFTNRPPIEAEAIRFQYTNWNHLNKSGINKKLLSDAVSDYYFVCPTNYFAEMYAKHGVPVYYYFFTQRTSSNPWGSWMGVMHGDEIEYVFGRPLNESQNFTQPERDLSSRMMKYYANFARNGNPVGNEASLRWPKYAPDDPEYFILNAHEVGTGSGPHAQACAFWNRFMPQLEKTVEGRGCPEEMYVTAAATSIREIVNLMTYKLSIALGVWLFFYDVI